MDISKIVNKMFWPVFAVVFVIVAVFIGKAVYESVYDAQVAKAFGEQTTEPEQRILNLENTFSCEDAYSRDGMNIGHVFVRGFGDHDINAFADQKKMLGEETPVLDFDYDEMLTLSEISSLFVSKVVSFVDSENLDVIVVLAESAGGVITSYSLPQLEDLIDDNTRIELHTLASPLNGYHVSESQVSGRVGFGREIGIGFEDYVFDSSLDDGVTVFHHKTVEDESLRSWCGEYAAYCDPIDIQDNNVAGSVELYYPQEDHFSIVDTVSKLVINCE